jgi:hypothetical protein
MAAAIGLRAWTLDALRLRGRGGVPRRQWSDELASSEYLSHRLGIAVVSAPIRREIAPAVDHGRLDVPHGDRPGREAGGHETATCRRVAADVADAGGGRGARRRADDEPALEPEPADVSY